MAHCDSLTASFHAFPAERIYFGCIFLSVIIRVEKKKKFTCVNVEHIYRKRNLTAVHS